MPGRVANRYLDRAFRWRCRFLVMLIVLIVGTALVPIFPPYTLSAIYACALLALTIGGAYAILAVCYYVYLGSVSSRGVFYAGLHVALILVLIPAGFLGVFLIPTLTNGDILRLRDWRRQHPKAM